ncbi:TPA: hypothetical protein OTQ06_002865 [Klebsiella aerogenes]|nr:hypothetical protein [Klebsiella aerogenes]
MTKSTITDERITSVIERLEHFSSNLKWTDVRGAQDLLTAADGLRELQERRKAAMDSEPVAKKVACWSCQNEVEISAIGDCDGCCPNCNSPIDLDEEPYAAPQLAPVVPEEMPCGGAADDYHDGYQDGWNACRAAMLAAAQPAPTIQVTDAMAYAFHHALTDGPLGDEDVEDIKTGLRASFATVTIKQPEPVVPVEATIDNKPNSSYEWRKGWNACLAAMLAVAPPAPKSTVK